MPGRSASSWHPSSSTPAGLAGRSAAGKRVPRQAVSTAAISGHGRKNKASPSAAAGASLPALWSGTKPPPKDADASLDHGQASAMRPRGASHERARGIPARAPEYHGDELRRSAGFHSHGSNQPCRLVSLAAARLDPDRGPAPGGPEPGPGHRGPEPSHLLAGHDQPRRPARHRHRRAVGGGLLVV